jgi:hypothetical protein
VQLLNPLEVRQLMRNTETFLQLLVRVLCWWIGDKIQDGAKALPRHGVDDVVEHVLLVVHPLEAKPGLGDGEPGLSVFSAQNVGRRREEPPLGCSLSIVEGYHYRET